MRYLQTAKFSFLVMSILLFCSGCFKRNDGSKEEQIRIDTLNSGQVINNPDSTVSNSIQGNLSFQQILSSPSNVILTGLEEHRIVTVYKTISPKRADKDYSDYYSYGYDGEDPFDDNGAYTHFMPGIDLVYGYNLINLAHYDFTTEKTNFLFDHPVLVKSLYFPSFVQDSVDEKPVNRDYFMVSVYDADTNQDTLINRADLRRFYYFNSTCQEKTQLLPPAYSVVKSQYDKHNDAMFLFARYDANKNGTIDKKEPTHIFWISLKAPAPAKRVY